MQALKPLHSSGGVRASLVQRSCQLAALGLTSPTQDPIPLALREIQKASANDATGPDGIAMAPHQKVTFFGIAH